MNSFIKSTPIVLILILCSSNSYSEPVRLERSQIKFQSSNNLKSSGFKLDSSSKSFAKFIEAANFEHIPTGAKARINAKITASVSRAGVLAGVPLRREIQHKGGSLCRNSPFSPRRIRNFQRRHTGTRLPIRPRNRQICKGLRLSAPVAA